MKDSVCFVRRFGVAVALAALAAGAAQGGSVYGGKLTLPHEVHWGATVLPPGEYKLEMETIAGPLRVFDSSGQIRVLVYADPDVANMTQPTAILITRDGAQRTVRSLNCPPWGRKLVFKPFTRAERDLMARGDQLETIPVRMASR